MSRTQTGVHSFNSCRLLFSTPDPMNGLDFEILNSQGVLHFYLIVHGGEIPPLENCPHQALITMRIEDKIHRILAFRHEGGQRILLPDASYSLIVSAFQKEQPVTFSAAGYSTTVPSGNFPEKLKQLHASAPISFPVQFLW